MIKKKLLQYKKVPLLIGVLFTIILFGTTLLYKQDFSNISSYKISDFFQNYSIYIPFALGLFSIIISYIFFIIFSIIRLNYLIITFLIYLLIYGFRLFLGIDLMYFEPRYTDFAIVLIDSYSIPLITSSSITLIIITILSLMKIKSKEN